MRAFGNRSACASLLLILLLSRSAETFIQILAPSSGSSRLWGGLHSVPDAQRRQMNDALQVTGRAVAALLAGVQVARAEDAAAAVPAVAAEAPAASAAAPAATKTMMSDTVYDFGAFKLPYFRQNLEFRQFLGNKATIVFNMKIDDPQTVLQFPDLQEIYAKYKAAGLNVHAFPTEQGWFEPDDDETCRLKAKEVFKFGDYPNSVCFDKIDLLGPSAHPLYAALTSKLSTPNGYGRVTLNYEKFLLDPSGNPVRRYPRKFSAYDMEPDIQAMLAGQPLPEESPAFLKAWREAKREVTKSEYAFRFNYNYYTSPDSMYKVSHSLSCSPPPLSPSQLFK